MSWYTYVYPTEGFDLSLSEDELQELIDDDEKILDSLWERIVGICVANPSLYKKEDPIAHIIDMVKKYFDKYVEVSHRQNHNVFNLRLVESIRYNEEYPPSDVKTPFRPYVEYNHFEYTGSPSSGIEEINKSISKIKKYIIACACATPSDIMVKDKDNDHYKDAISYITSELEEHKVWLDYSLYDQDFCILLDKYYDTHKQG